MEKKITSDVLALSSFLDGICGGSKLDGREMGVGVDVSEVVEHSAEGNSDPEMEVRRGADPAWLLEIVSSFARCLFAAYTVNRGKYPH